MTRKTILAVVTVICVATALVWQRNALAGLRVRNQELLAMKAEVDRLTVENEGASVARIAASQLTENLGNELLRLRGEVRQLRAQQPQIDRLRAENEGLAAAIRAGASQPQDFSRTEGFLAKESWSNAGFAAADATLKTFFWAIREGDVATLANCLPPKSRQHMLRLTEQGNEEERDRTLEEFRRLISGAGIRLTEQSSTAEGRATIGIQAVAGGSILKLQLRRYGAEWKLEDF